MKKMQKRFLGNVGHFLAYLGVIVALSSLVAQAGETQKKKGKRLSWADCCNQYDSDTDVCLKKVKKHKEKVGKQWVNKVCPQKQMESKKVESNPTEPKKAAPAKVEEVMPDMGEESMIDTKE